MAGENAVYVRGACKTYGDQKNPVVVLKDLDMTVPRGAIYGLLGASGCGKTTLLSAIVGIRPLDSGELVVLGGKPGNKDSGVPGHRVGFMPQDVSLMNSLTIKQTMKYFCWIYGMSSKDFDTQMDYFLELLELPHGDTLISKLSGGQQRRVSLMAALIHDPELLILDEPTVGVDPMLRQRVWKYLVQETRRSGKTVIITTHYIQEAGQADVLGLIRGGRLMDENSPENLLQKYNTGSVETVFLVLAMNQELEALRQKEKKTNDLQAVNVDEAAVTKSEPFEGKKLPRTKEYVSKGEEWEAKRRKRARTGRWKAMVLKSGLRFFKSRDSLAFNFLFPLIQIVVFFLAIGADPKQLPFTIINRETPYFTENCSTVEPMMCDDPYVGCRYAQQLSNSKYFKVNYMEDQEEALEGVRRGKSWGVLVIPENFTESIHRRRLDGLDADADLLEMGFMRVHLDMSNSQIGTTIKKQLLEEYVTFSGELMEACEMNRKIIQTPIRFEHPIYGEEDSTFQEFSAPPTILIVIFFLAVGTTSSVMVTERYEGLWDRTLVAGITPWQLLVGHIMMQTIMVFLQSIESLIIALLIFGFPCHGPIFLSLLLTWLQGVAGMCCGFFVSVSSRTISESNYFATGCFYPVVLMGGSLWPLQGAPKLFQQICNIMPTTMANIALRHIMIRGWGIQKSSVILGFASTFAWIAVFLVLCYVILRLKR
ncbi:ABC transporter G family member 23-like [Ischnura elegans]|uniref:ABC transporter G family member 23-like n=1 Tax=Ischnura elegans TaxID=197161 RepID=UPI001ED88321|nr:ABC transporter G family member 23-like [Ischnura elegans]XP_046382484.1 ABC transporter G family member 23-like [Ischnura elegans]